MPNVCVTCVWKIAHPVFAAWFAVAVVVANFGVVRLTVRVSFARGVALDGLISGLTVLRILEEKTTQSAFWRLALANLMAVSVAVQPSVVYVLRHPAEA